MKYISEKYFKKILTVAAAIIMVSAGLLYWTIKNPNSATASWWPLARWANGPEGTTTGYRI
ncbi:MAG: hypothetical protein V1867_06320 [Candidatus Falkowbacteria bacterium]